MAQLLLMLADLATATTYGIVCSQTVPQIAARVRPLCAVRPPCYHHPPYPPSHRRRGLSIGYQSHVSGDVTQEIPAWFIGMQITKHEDHCQVREVLRDTARPAVDPGTGHLYDPARRLQLSREATCTCQRGRND